MSRYQLLWYGVLNRLLFLFRRHPRAIIWDEGPSTLLPPSSFHNRDRQRAKVSEGIFIGFLEPCGLVLSDTKNVCMLQKRFIGFSSFFAFCEQLVCFFIYQAINIFQNGPSVSLFGTNPPNYRSFLIHHKSPNLFSNWITNDAFAPNCSSLKPLIMWENLKPVTHFQKPQLGLFCFASCFTQLSSATRGRSH